MVNNETVCAVIVTYNRKDLLIECLSALCKQTRSIDAMYIIDNFSTDGTANILKENGYIDKLPPEDLNEPYEIEINFNDKLKIYYVRMNTNTGGAGGFYEGQKRAYDRGFDWLWLMDDDGYAPDKCLEIILDDAKKNNLKAINPLVVNKENHSKLSFGLAGTKDTKEAILKSKNNIILNHANPFNGTLLHKDIMNKCGFIKKEMFIWGDETEYQLRLKSNNINYATTVNSYYFHPESKTVTIPGLFGLINISKKPEKLEMNYYRNLGYLNGKYENNLNIKILIKYSLFYISKGEFRKIIKFFKYFFDGRSGRYKLPNFS